MVDIHCHILPDVDDGPTTWEASTAMCRMAAADGVQHIVATPHANYEYEYDRAAHEERLARLRVIAGNVVSLSLGCDFHFTYENLQGALAEPGRYCIGDTRYLLVEFSDFAIPPTTSDHLKELVKHGITPIITHPERNPILQRHPEQLAEFFQLGALLQVTANALTGRWGKVSRKMAETLLRNGMVHVLASDAHDLRDRKPVLSEGREAAARLVSPEAARALVNDNPRAIISGQPVPFVPQPA